MSSSYTIHADRIFVDDGWVYGRALQIDRNSGIMKVIERSNTACTADRTFHTIIPSLVDIQIYGAAECLLSAIPTVDTVRKIATQCRNGGALYFQPTVATNDFDVTVQAIEAVRMYKATEDPYGYCIGIHLEGPWISSSKRGAHQIEYVHIPSIEEVKKLLDIGDGVISMITLAPEVIEDPNILSLIASRGIVISAGHSDIDYASATRCFNGETHYMQQRDPDQPAPGQHHHHYQHRHPAQPLIRTCTHLYNAMSSFSHRSPGLVGAIFDHHSVMSSIVVDGHHVDYAAVRIAHRLMNMNKNMSTSGGRLFCITDAVTTTATGAYQHYLNGDRYEHNGVLSGSSLTMWKAMMNLIHHVGVDETEAIRMCSSYPAKAMMMRTMTMNEMAMGCLRDGGRAEFVVLDENMNIQEVWSATDVQHHLAQHHDES